MKIYANQPEDQQQNAVKSENPNAFSDRLTNPTEKEKLKDLHGKDKIDYIWDYYKVPILIGIIAIAVIISIIYERTHAKKSIVTITCTNVSMDDYLRDTLTTGFLRDFTDLKPSKYEVIVDENLMVGDSGDSVDPQYAYTSQMKLMAYLAAGQMDLVLMNQAGFDELAGNGFLQDLSEVFAALDPELNEVLKDQFVMNEVIREDNSSEIMKNPDLEYQAVTETLPFGLKLSGSKFVSEDYFNQDVYVGIAVNSTKTEACMQFLHYLYGLEPGDFNLIPEK